MSVIAAAEEDVKAGEHMHLSEVRFLLRCPSVSEEEKASLKEELLAGVRKYGTYTTIIMLMFFMLKSMCD